MGQLPPDCPGMKIVLIVLFLSLVFSEPRRRKDLPRTSDGYQVAKAGDGNGQRKGKVFSLFNVIQFNNGPCRTGSSERNGTCYTENECSDKGGTASGNCAAGFGVCCVFTTTETSATISENCTYIQNPGFPSPFTDTASDSSFTYTADKLSEDVCQLRLDFEMFNILGPALTTETEAVTGDNCPDTLTVTVPSSQAIPTICGQNDGEHIYIDYGDSDSIRIAIDLNAVGTDDTTGRQWEIKVTQVECWNPSAAPSGCLQYSTGLTGRFTTFNFQGNDGHLNNNQYSHCIRQECGYCCVQYQVCTDTDSWSLDQGVGFVNAVPMHATVDTLCTIDFIAIPESSRGCSGSMNGVSFNNRYCGPLLGATKTATASIPICDCTPPFVVDVFTDGLDDSGMSTGTGNTALSRGACLTWQQLPC